MSAAQQTPPPADSVGTLPAGDAPGRGRLLVLHDRFIEPDGERPRACLAALTRALERLLSKHLTVATAEVPLEEAADARHDPSRSPAATVLPTGKFAGIVILFSAVQPRSLGAANATLDACLHATHVPTAICAVHVPLLEAAAVRSAHEAARVPLLTWAVLARFCAAKERMLDRAGLPRPVVPFALSLLPTSALPVPQAAGPPLAAGDDDCVDDLARWLTYSYLQTRQQQQQQQTATRSVPGQRGNAARTDMPPPPPPPPEDLRESVWTAHLAAGAARRTGLENSSAWFGVRVPDACTQRTLYANRDTKEVTWRAPQALVDAALMTGNGASTSSSAYGTVREASCQPETLYRQRKAIAQQVANAAAEAAQLRDAVAEHQQQRVSQPVLDESASGLADEVSARASHLQELQTSVTELAQQRNTLKREAAARAEERRDLECQLAVAGRHTAATDRLPRSTSPVHDDDDDTDEIAAAKAQLAALEEEVAHRKKIRAELDDWAPKRSRLTKEYVDRWKANQAVRGVLRGIKQDVAKLREQHRAIDAGRVAALDRRREWLDQRISGLYTQLDQLHGDASADARHNIRTEQLRIDKAIMRHRDSCAAASWARKDLAMRVYHKEVEAAAQALQQAVRRGAQTHDSLLCVADELRRVHAQRCTSLQAQHREAQAAASRPAFHSLSGPVPREGEAAILAMVAKDADIAALMTAEALARGCVLEADQALELTGAVAAWHAGALVAAQRALATMRHKADAL